MTHSTLDSNTARPNDHDRCLNHCYKLDNPYPTEFNNIDFLYGLREYGIRKVEPGQIITLTITLPEGVVPDTYHTFAGDSENQNDHWFEFIDNGETGAIIQENIITLNFSDAMRGDIYRDTDSMVVNVGGPGFIEPDKLRSTIDDHFDHEKSEEAGCFIVSIFQQ